MRVLQRCLRVYSHRRTVHCTIFGVILFHFLRNCVWNITFCDIQYLTDINTFNRELKTFRLNTHSTQWQFSCRWSFRRIQRYTRRIRISIRIRRYRIEFHVCGAPLVGASTRTVRCRLWPSRAVTTETLSDAWRRSPPGQLLSGLSALSGPLLFPFGCSA